MLSTRNCGYRQTFAFQVIGLLQEVVGGEFHKLCMIEAHLAACHVRTNGMYQMPGFQTSGTSHCDLSRWYKYLVSDYLLGLLLYDRTAMSDQLLGNSSVELQKLIGGVDNCVSFFLSYISLDYLHDDRSVVQADKSDLFQDLGLYLLARFYVLNHFPDSWRYPFCGLV